MTGGNLSGAFRYSLFQSEHSLIRGSLCCTSHSSTGPSPASGCHGESFGNKIRYLDNVRVFGCCCAGCWRNWVASKLFIKPSLAIQLCTTYIFVLNESAHSSTSILKPLWQVYHRGSPYLLVDFSSFFLVFLLFIRYPRRGVAVAIITTFVCHCQLSFLAVLHVFPNTRVFFLLLECYVTSNLLFPLVLISTLDLKQVLYECFLWLRV